MAMDIKRLKQQWAMASALKRVIVVNGVVWIALRLAVIVMMFGGAPNPEWDVLRWVEMPSYLPDLARYPWTILTYMFAQYDVLHIVFNMLWLYWFGMIFLDIATPRRFFGLYLLGGIGGALLYLIAYNLLPFFSGTHGVLIGSSAAVIAIVTATAITVPDYKIGLLFLGAVSLKWVAIVTILIDLLSVTGANAGGHLAHLGGALVGVIYALSMRHGHDITAPLNSIIDRIVNLFRRKPRMNKFQNYRRSTSTPPPRKPQRGSRVSREDQDELDAILDKIKKSGYTSLTPEERKRLFDVSRRIK